MSKLTVAFAICLVAASAFAQAPASGDETPAADQSKAVTSASQAAATEAAAEEKEFKPPVGFIPKKRGALVLYCKKDSTIGTRFQTEKCYSEAQVRDYIIAQQENKRDIDRVRSTCSSGVAEVCSAP
jgi:hypothetical protein